MNIDLELYRIFYTVAKYENISKATEELFISQPAITQRINNLEKQLNIQLFCRKPSGMKLTNEGKQLYSYIKDSIETMNNVENKFDNYLQRNKKNTIKIKATNIEDNLLICKTIIPFLEKNNDFAITIDIGTEEEILQEILNGTVDLIAINNKFKIKNKNLQIILSKKHDICFYTSKKYLEKYEGIIDICNNSDKYSFILPKRNSFEKLEFNKLCEKYNLSLESKYESDSIDIRNYFVSKGLGIGIGFRQCIEDKLKRNVFIEVPIKEKLPCYYVDLVINNKREDLCSVFKFDGSLNYK